MYNLVQALHTTNTDSPQGGTGSPHNKYGLSTGGTIWYRLSTQQILMCLTSVAVYLFLVLKNLITTVSFLSVHNEHFPENSVTY
jgi:hypothetical protein